MLCVPFQETDNDVQPCEFGEAVASLSPHLEVNRFAEQHICKSVEWLYESDMVLDEGKHLWKAVVGSADVTEMLEDLERVFLTVYKQNYSFGSNSMNSTTLYDNNFMLALEIRTPLNADDLEEIENLCWKFVPNDTKKSLIYSVDLKLNLSSSTDFNISCLMSKTPNSNFKLSYLSVRF